MCLRRAVNLIDGRAFDNYEENHAFNDIYEGLLKELQAAGKQGEYYTPRALTNWITERVAPRLGETVADFASGTGGFAVSALEYIREHIGIKRAEEEDIIQENILCIEKKQLPYILCTTNLLLHGIADQTLKKRYNTTGELSPVVYRSDLTQKKTGDGIYLPSPRTICYIIFRTITSGAPSNPSGPSINASE